MSLWTLDHLSLLVLAVLLLVTDLRHSKQMFGFVEDVGSSLIMFDQFFIFCSQWCVWFSPVQTLIVNLPH